MAKRHRELLDRLDPGGLTHHQITEKDVRTVEQYLSLIQAHLNGGSTWGERVKEAKQVLDRLICSG